MTDIDQLTNAAVGRIAGHVRELRQRYPSGLAQLNAFVSQRGDGSLPEWPVWCWVPMAGSAAIVQAAGRVMTAPDDIGRVAAIGQWCLTGRRIIVPAEQVATRGIPEPAPPPQEDFDAALAAMDVQIPKDRILAELGGICYYLVTPVQPSAPVPDYWMWGCYLHLEYDVREGRAELRILPDTGRGWDRLVPTWLYLDYPTLAQATAAAQRQMIKNTRGKAYPEWLPEIAASAHRSAIWGVWPLLAALLDSEAYLRGPRPVTETDDPVMQKAQVWDLSYEQPPDDQPSPV